MKKTALIAAILLALCGTAWGQGYYGGRGGGSMTYPGAGIPNSTGSAWGTSLTLDTDLSSVSGSDDSVPSAKATKAALDGKVATHAALTSIMALTETQGGIPYFTVDNTWAVLAKGTAGQLLQMNSGATAPEWTSSLTGPFTFGNGASDIQVYLYKNDTDTHWSGNAIVLTAHENVAIGQLVFINSDGEAALAKADADATLPAVGIVVVAGTTDNPCTVLTHGTITNDAWNFTAGNIIHVSAATAGLATATAPSTSTNIVQRVGIALSDDTVLFSGGLTTVTVP